ncbi:MAG: protein translocase subunit SecD [Acidobacteria bacterium]|nr:protein translocase subunit SecD [Acidobacteriota bacterium]MCI0661673.1 protein translocase subunit SecD [Acidobacteriota bacterium]
MDKKIGLRSIIIGVVTLACLVLLFGPWNKEKDYKITAGDFFKPAKLRQNITENIRLGLDLKGGTHLVIQVQVDDYLKTLTENNSKKAVDELKKEGIPFKDVKVQTTGLIVIETPDTTNHQKIEDMLLPSFGSDAWEATDSSNPPSVTFKLLGSAADYFRRQATDQAKRIIEKRIDQFGVAEPTIQMHGRAENHQILVQMPGVDDPVRVKQLIKGEAKLEFKAVVPPGTTYESREKAIESLGGALTIDRQVLPVYERRAGQRPIEGFQVVERTPIIGGADLREAHAAAGQQGGAYRIAFSVKPGADEIFGEWTGKNVGNYLAIVLNDQIQSAPVVQDKISSNGEINGNFTRQEAEDLSLMLRSGSLPAKIIYLEERTVGPSLGADSIRQGLTSLVAGLIFVAGFMLFYYRLSGVNAVLALLLNLVILLAGLALFNATLTLPGIAGVILGIGMAVDANVLVFERIRDELRAGRIATAAMEAGFDKAIVTIIDTHVTTVVSAGILYLFGTGPVRGFAVTLVIGLLANLFTAVFVSRTMYLWVLYRGGRRAETISV